MAEKIPNQGRENPDTKSGLSEDLVQSIINLPQNQKDELIQILQQDKLENRASMGEVDVILEVLRQKKYVSVEENKEIFGCKGKIIHVDLPEVPGSDFKGFKFDFFVGLRIMNETFEEDADLENHSFSVEKIGKILKNIIEYMKARGVEYDIDVDYEKGLNVQNGLLFFEISENKF